VELDECSSKNEIMVSRSYQHLLNGVYDINLKFPQANKLVGWMKTTDDVNPIYIAVKNKENGGLYSLRTIFLKEKEMNPYENFYLRDNARLRWSIDGNDLFIRAGSLDCLNECLVPYPSVRYEVIFDKDFESLDMKLKCQRAFSFFNTSDYVQKFISIPLKVEELKHLVGKETTEIFVNARAIFYLNGVEFSFYYDPVQVYLASPHIQPGSSWSIWIVIFLLIVLGVAAFIIFKKYKHVQMRLKYEMNDVRNVANLNRELETTTSKEKNKYTGLVLTDTSV
jgi:hypothetical protein